MTLAAKKLGRAGLRSAYTSLGVCNMLVGVTESWLGTGHWSGSNDAIYSLAILTAGLVQWCENCGGNNLISESGHSCILSTLYTTAANGTSQNSTKFGEVRYGLLLVAKIITGF